MKARIGDAEFDYEGDEHSVTEAFQTWLAMIKKRARWPILQRIAELDGELSAQRDLLKRMDEEQ